MLTGRWVDKCIERGLKWGNIRSEGVLEGIKMQLDLLVSGVRYQVSGIRKLECGMRKIRKGAGRMHSIKSDSFRARPRNQNFIGDEGRVRG